MVTIRPDIQSAIILTPNEHIKGCWESNFTDSDLAKKQNPNNPQICVFHGCLVATNKKIVFVQKKGFFSEKFFTKDSTDWENIQGITVDTGILKNNLIIMKQSQGIQHEHVFNLIKNENGRLMSKEETHNFKTILESFIKERYAEIEREKQQSRVQYVIDFSFLKAEMEKGGITLTTIKCPSCGGNVDLPEKGNSIQCKFCNSAIHAHDIFDKMKAFVDKL